MTTSMRDAHLKDLPASRLETDLPDVKPRLGEAQAVAEAQRCLYCYDAPCITACPTGIDIPKFIKRIANGDLKGSAKAIFESNILGMSCARVCPVEVLCVGACVYNHKHEPPILIGKLQRVATDWAYDRNIQYVKAGPATGKAVALVGSGPASLACAHELVRLGHRAVIFEKRDVAGGLNTTGVAPYKMHAEDALREVAYVAQIGIEFKYGVDVGQDVTFEQLEKEYDAVFLGVGLGADSRLNLPGQDLPGVVGAVEWIDKMKSSPRFSIDHIRHAVIVGGGNTAIDVARELGQFGVPYVTIVYRRSKGEMPGYDHEVFWSKKDGVRYEFLALPERVEGAGKVERLVCRRMKLGEPDASGRRAPVPTDDTFALDADLIAIATGQEKYGAWLEKHLGIRVDQGRIRVDGATGQTSNPKYFAGGDCVNGGKEVVNGAAEGKLAARGIDSHLRGQGA